MPEAVNLAGLLQEPDIFLHAGMENKAAILAAAATRLAEIAGIESETVLTALSDREKLGSTAINHGVAVPHAVVDALPQPAAVFFRLARPIGFEAPDNNPVDLVFVVIWPSDKRSGLLATLGGLCRSLRETSLRQDLRKASDAAEVRSLLAGDGTPAAASSRN